MEVRIGARIRNGRSPLPSTAARLAALEEEDSDLAEIEINKMTGFVGNIAAKVSTDDAMPSWIILLIKFLLNISCNVLQEEKEKNVY